MSGRAKTVFRIARETQNYKALDVSGAGAASEGGRWNAPRTLMVYASLNRALAAIEALVHIKEPRLGVLPMDRYLVEIRIPFASWRAREIFDSGVHRGWDSIPVSKTAADWGTAWARELRSLVAVVPSVIVPEESNVLLNPLHPDAGLVEVSIARKWLYDPRVGL